MEENCHTSGNQNRAAITDITLSTKEDMNIDPGKVNELCYLYVCASW